MEVFLTFSLNDIYLIPKGETKFIFTSSLFYQSLRKEIEKTRQSRKYMEIQNPSDAAVFKASGSQGHFFEKNKTVFRYGLVDCVYQIN